MCLTLSQTGAKRTQMLVYEYVPNGSLLDYITGKLQLLACNTCLAFLNM
jgi:hypothetical protein